jgi:hypothetical protein
MMREGSAMVTTVHSIARYFSLSAATSRYQGKYVGFVGDRLATREPGPVLLQATKVGHGSRNRFESTVKNYFRPTRVA